jgi:hypothetical protein
VRHQNIVARDGNRKATELPGSTLEICFEDTGEFASIPLAAVHIIGTEVRHDEENTATARRSGAVVAVHAAVIHPGMGSGLCLFGFLFCLLFSRNQSTPLWAFLGAELVSTVLLWFYDALLSLLTPYGYVMIAER